MTQRIRHSIIPIATLLLVTSMAGGGRILAQQNQTRKNESPLDADPSRSPDTSKWKLYRNEKYGFQVRYPETWAVSPSRGDSPQIIYFRGPYRGGVIGRALTVAVQPNMNPHKLSIEEWFAQQMRAVGGKCAFARRGKQAIEIEFSWTLRDGADQATSYNLAGQHSICGAQKFAFGTVLGSHRDQSACLEILNRAPIARLRLRVDALSASRTRATECATM